MFEKDEMDYTIKQMIEDTIFNINDCAEYNDAICILNQLSEVVFGDEDKAKEYWYDTLCSISDDIPTYLSSFVAEKDLPIMTRIIDKLYPNRIVSD